jgi:hypothetical protein
VNDLFTDVGQMPAQAAYYPALQNLQKAVTAANTALGH